MAPNRREKEKRKVRYTDAKKQAEQQESGYTPTAYKLPKGVSAFRFKKAGAYRIDIMPYVVSKGKDVKGGNPNADEGDVHYERTFYVHQNVGVDNSSYACLRKTFGKSCPICEHCARLAREPGVDEEIIQKMKDKTRKLFIFKDHGDPDKGFQIYETGHYKSFGELLNDKVLAADEDEAILRFYHLDDGVTLKIFCKEDSFNGRKFFKATDISAIARKEQYDESVLDEVPDLDQVVADGELSYDDLKEIFEQGADVRDRDEDEPAPKEKKAEPKDDEEEDEPLPTRKPASKHKKQEVEEEDEAVEIEEEEDEEPDEDEEPEEDEEDDKPSSKKIKTGSRVKHKKFGECDVIHVSPDGSSLKLEDDEGNIHKPINAKDVTMIDEDDEPEEEEEAPPLKKPAGKKPTAKKVVEEEEEEEELEDDEIPFEDDDEEPEEEEEAPPPKKKTKK